MSKTRADLRDAVIADLSPTYDLVYVHYDSQLSDDQVGFLVAGDSESLFDSLTEWEADSQHEAIPQIIDGLVDDVIRRWVREDEEEDELDILRAGFDRSEEWEQVAEEIRERDNNDYIKELARNTGKVLLRIPIEAMSEDAGLSFRDLTAAEVLGLIGFEPTERNTEEVDYALNNASPEFSVNMGYWIAGVDVEDLWAMPGDEDTQVELVNPYLYIGNPLSGSGFVTEQPLHGSVVLSRKDLRTDKKAFGWSINAIYGGVYASSFEVEIKSVTPTPKEPVS